MKPFLSYYKRRMTWIVTTILLSVAAIALVRRDVLLASSIVFSSSSRQATTLTTTKILQQQQQQQEQQPNTPDKNDDDDSQSSSVVATGATSASTAAASLWLNGTWTNRSTPFEFECPKEYVQYSCKTNPHRHEQYRYDWTPNHHLMQDQAFSLDQQDDATKTAGTTNTNIAELLLQAGSITFIGDSFSRLLFETLSCYLNTQLDDVLHVRKKSIDAELHVDCTKSMKLYGESKSDCQKKHGIVSYAFRRKKIKPSATVMAANHSSAAASPSTSSNESENNHDDDGDDDDVESTITFMWAPFLVANKLTNHGKRGSAGYTRHLELDTSTFPSTMAQKTFLETATTTTTRNAKSKSNNKNKNAKKKSSRQTVVLLAERHWVNPWYRMYNGTKWIVRSSQEMTVLHEQALKTSLRWLSKRDIPSILIHETFNTSWMTNKVEDGDGNNNKNDTAATNDNRHDHDESGLSVLPSPPRPASSTTTTTTTTTTLNLGTSQILNPPGGIQNAMSGSHWCNEFLPWHIVRVLLQVTSSASLSSSSSSSSAIPPPPSSTAVSSSQEQQQD